MVFSSFAVSQEVKRPVLLGVPRDSVVLSAHQCNKYGKYLQAIVSFYNELQLMRKAISAQLVSMLEREVNVIGQVYCFLIYTNKMVVYSPFIDRILKIKIAHQHKLNVHQKVILVYITILSESLNHFIDITGRFMGKKETLLKLNTLEGTMILYNEIWTKKW